MEIKTFHDYLVHGHVTALEEALNLKQYIGFGNAYFDFDETKWGEDVNRLNADEHYRKFLANACDYPSLVGTVEDRDNKFGHTITIILYQGSYRVQVETRNNSTWKTEYYTGVFKEYIQALRFAYSVVTRGI